MRNSYSGWADRAPEGRTPGKSQMLSEDWKANQTDGKWGWTGSAEIEIYNRTEMGGSSLEDEL